MLIAVLSACAGTAGLSTPPPATPATAAAAPEPAPSAAAPARPAGPQTTEQINTECWMRADADSRLRDVDARLAYVNRCIAERGQRR
jgi:hypothetical protein